MPEIGTEPATCGSRLNCLPVRLATRAMMSVISTFGPPGVAWFAPPTVAGSSAAGAAEAQASIRTSAQIPVVFTIPCSVCQLVSRRRRREAELRFIPEAILLPALENLFATQGLTPFVLDEVTAVGLRLRDEFDPHRAIDTPRAVARAGRLVAPRGVRRLGGAASRLRRGRRRFRLRPGAPVTCVFGRR